MLTSISAKSACVYMGRVYQRIIQYRYASRRRTTMKLGQDPLQRNEDDAPNPPTQQPTKHRLHLVRHLQRPRLLDRCHKKTETKKIWRMDIQPPPQTQSLRMPKHDSPMHILGQLILWDQSINAIGSCLWTVQIVDSFMIKRTRRGNGWRTREIYWASTLSTFEDLRLNEAWLPEELDTKFSKMKMQPTSYQDVDGGLFSTNHEQRICLMQILKFSTFGSRSGHSPQRFTYIRYSFCKYLTIRNRYRTTSV